MGMTHAKIMVESQEDQNALEKIQGALGSHEHGIADMFDDGATLSPHGPQMSDGSHHSDDLHEKWPSCLQLFWCRPGWDDDERELRRELIHVDGQQSFIRLQRYKIGLAHWRPAGACWRRTGTEAGHRGMQHSFLLTWPVLSLGFGSGGR